VRGEIGLPILSRRIAPATMSTESLPLLQHALESPSEFTPERLMAAVGSERGLTHVAVPPLCVLDLDRDPSDHLAAQGSAFKGAQPRIVLSVWDFFFGTAYWPRQRSPERLGYPGMQEMPLTLHGKVLWPATRHPGTPVAGPEASLQ